MADVVGRIDRFQRRHPAVGFPIAVVYKFFDDQGSYLAAIITYYAFIAIFPLLLIASSVLGFVLQGDPALKAQVLDSALAQFPIIGDQLGRPEGLHGSTSAVAVGAITALYGALGLSQAGQNLLHVAWAVPRNSRPNPFLSRLRGLLLLGSAGIAVLVVALLSNVATNTALLRSLNNATVHALIIAVTVLLNMALFTVLMRLATARRHTLAQTVPGAAAAAVMWQGLQLAGATYVTHVIAKATAMNQTFAVVLGLVALIYIAAVMAVLSVEINVVLAKVFYPRALLSPFTDDVDLAGGDQRAYAAYAKAQRHKGFEHIRVSFEPPGDTTTTTEHDRTTEQD